MIMKNFDKDCSLITKGLLIIFLLIHHLFIGDAYEKYNIISILPFRLFTDNIAAYMKVCISGFAFISAYGITKQFRKVISGGGNRCLFKVSVRRMLKLYLSF